MIVVSTTTVTYINMDSLNYQKINISITIKSDHFDQNTTT